MTCQLLVFAHQIVLRLHHLWVQGDAFHRTNLHALRLVKMTHALGAFVRVDLVNGRAKVNGLVGALGFTDITIDALTGDHQSHKSSNSLKK